MDWVWSNRVRSILIYLIVLGIVGTTTAAPNPNFSCPGYTPDEKDEYGLEREPNSSLVLNKVSVDAFRYYVGCNKEDLKKQRSMEPARYRLLQQYYINAINKSLNDIRDMNGTNGTIPRARRVPLCVRSTHLRTRYLKQMGNFYEIIKELEEKEKEFENAAYWVGDPPIWYPPKSKDYMVNTDTDFGVEDIRLFRIFTGDERMPVLRQWFHMAIYLKENMTREGIYIQAISSPQGLPFGEFRNDFDCDHPDIPLMSVSEPYDHITHRDRPVASGGERYYADSLVFPCTYRAAYHLRHPNVWTVGGSPKGARVPKRYNEFHIHFNWIDATCHENSAMQFLIILVDRFDQKKYKVFYTPGLNHTYYDSNDGLPYPFYPGWAENRRISCNGESRSIYNEVSQAFIETGNIPEPANTDTRYVANDMPESDYPQRDDFESPARDEYPSEGDESEFFNLLNRGEPESSQNDENVPKSPELDSPANHERKRRIDDLEVELASLEIDSVGEDKIDTSREVKSEEKSTYPSEDDEVTSTTSVPPLETSTEADANQRLLNEYQKMSQKRNDVKENDDIFSSTMSTVRPHKPLANATKMKKVPTGSSNNTSQSDKNGFLKRRKRQTNPKNARENRDRILGSSKCTDRTSCISGQFQIIRTDFPVIPYNLEYDNCVMGKTNVITEAIPLECPPQRTWCEKYHGLVDKRPELRTKLRAQVLRQQMCDFCTFPDDSLIFRSETPPEHPVIEPTREGTVGEDGVFRKRPVAIDSLIDIGFKMIPVYPIYENGTIRTDITTPAPPTIGTTTTKATTTTTPMTTAMPSTTTPVPEEGGDPEDPDGHIPEGRLKHFDRLIIYKNQVNKFLHGWILIYAWFFLAPAANFAARYYKESGGLKGGGVCGMPMWLVAHIGLYTYAFVCMGVGVVSVAFLVDLNCDRLPLAEDKKFCEANHGELLSAHVVFGVLALFCLLPQYVLGWIRPMTLSIQYFIQIIHSCGGYMGFLFAVVSVYLTQTCPEIYILATLMAVIHGVFWLVGCVFQTVQDKKLGLTRRVFPVLQVVEIRDNPPQGLAKKILQYAHDLSIGAISLILMFSYNKIAMNDPLTNLDYDYASLNNESSRLLKFNGLFPIECSRINYIYFLQQIGCDDSGTNATKVTFWCNNPKNETI